MVKNRMNTGEKIEGFQVKKITEVPEAGGIFYELEHEKTKAKVGWMKTEDENKTFSITFKTIPENDTGVFHILEHSVLQGSEKYPLKAPFVELIKGSLNTFLNAMTYPDRTVYPVSSRNAKDFENLMRVYLDAVFHPLLHQDEKIFQQEGWHYECVKEGDVPAYNGVVLNEMRGAQSSVDSLIYNQMQAALFPDTCYRFVSGGTPEAITDLSYEAYRAAHKKYYHPSNSYTVLDGDLDISSTLALLNQVFNAFNREEKSFAAQMQCAQGMQHATHEYAVEKEGEHQGYLALGYTAGRFDDAKTMLAAKVLAQYLADINEAPLKKAVIESGIGYDVQAGLIDGILQPFFMITIRNMEPKKRKEAEELVRHVIETIKRDGVDKERLDAILCRVEFAVRERDFGGYPTGLVNAMTIIESWVYGGEPTSGFSVNECVRELRDEIKEDKFITYLDRIFLENDHCASVLMMPSETLMEKTAKKEKNKLTAFWEQCDDTARKNVWDSQLRLKAWQETPNTQEQVGQLPGLSITDIDSKPQRVSLKVLSDGTLWHHADTRGIRYLRLLFPIGSKECNDVSEAAFLAELIGHTELTDCSRTNLQIKKSLVFGSLYAYIEIAKQTAYLCVDVSYLETREQEALDLLWKILSDSIFDAEAAMQNARQQYENGRQAFVTSGHSMAMMHAKAAVSKKAAMEEAAGGPVYVMWLKNVLTEIENDPVLFAKKLEQTLQRIVQMPGMLVSVTSNQKEEQYTEKMRKMQLQLIKKQAMKMQEMNLRKTNFDSHESKMQELNLQQLNLQESKSAATGFSIAAPVSYCAKAQDMNALGIENSGKWLVLAKLVSMDYLWNRVRVLGGAYGVGMNTAADGMVSFYSYRDPSPEKSLHIFDQSGAFLREFAKENPDLTRIIIGTISDTEGLYTPRSMAQTADNWYLNGITDEMRATRRKEILSVTGQDLNAMSYELDRICENMAVSVVAEAKTLGACDSQLQEIVTV